MNSDNGISSKGGSYGDQKAGGRRYLRVRISIVDKGALDCTIKARIEGAVFRAVDQYDNIPWGGAVR